MRTVLPTLLLAAVATIASAQSAFQIAPDDQGILFQKSIGGERWVVLMERSRAYGNVYFPDGSAPAFVSCDVDHRADDLVFRCGGADACTTEPCGEFMPLTEVTLPPSFFPCTQGDPDPITGMFALNCPLESVASAPVRPTGSAPESPPSPSGVQLSHDRQRVLFQKDVGGERWSAFYDPNTQAVVGSVFTEDGDPPVFIACRGIDETEDEITYECFAAGPCTGTCTSANYEPIGMPTLPRTLFAVPPLPDEPLDEVAIATGVLADGIDVASDGTNYVVAYSDGAGRVQRLDASGSPLDVEAIDVTAVPTCKPLEVPSQFPEPMESLPPSIAFASGRFHVTWPLHTASHRATITRAMSSDGTLEECAAVVSDHFSVGSGSCSAIALPPLLSVPFLDGVLLGSHGDLYCLPLPGRSVSIFHVGRQGDDAIVGPEWRFTPHEGMVSLSFPLSAGPATLAAGSGAALAAWWDVDIGTVSDTSTVQLRVSIHSFAPPIERTLAETAYSLEEDDSAPRLASGAIDGTFLLAWLAPPQIHTIRLSKDGEELGRKVLYDQANGGEHIAIASTDEHQLVTWTERVNAARRDLRGILLDSSGAIVRGVETLAEDVTGPIDAAAADSGFLVAYLRENPGDGAELFVRGQDNDRGAGQ